jgi:hypothetical protein
METGFDRFQALFDMSLEPRVHRLSFSRRSCRRQWSNVSHPTGTGKKLFTSHRGSSADLPPTVRATDEQVIIDNLF